MAGWTVAPDEPENGRDKVKQKVEVDKIWVDVGGCKAKSLFDKFVHVVWEEIGSGSGFMRPLPPRLGDGKCVDLFRVFLTVSERGGCKRVTEVGLWNMIGESCGLGCGVGGSLKLVYVKYLDVLERCLDRIPESKSSKEDLGKSRDETGRMLSDLEEYLECLLTFIAVEKKKNTKVSIFNLLMSIDSEALLIKKEKKTGVSEEDYVDTADCMMCTSEVMDEDSGGSENPDYSSLNLYAGSEVPGAQADSNGSKTDIAKEPDDEVNNMNDADNDIMIQSGANKDGFTSQKKRKRESLLGMLNWLTETAKRPCDPASGVLPGKSKWKSYGNDVLWKQVLAAREELFFRQKFDSKSDQEIWLLKYASISNGAGSFIPASFLKSFTEGFCISAFFEGTEADYTILQRRQMIPSMYEGRMPERPRSSRKPTTANKSRRLDGVGDSSQHKAGSDDGVDRPTPRVGKEYQADLPKWGNSNSESDLKWLGTRIWPLEKTEKRSFYENVPIGRGRQDGCGCPIACSVECVRFHISEKSTRLKPELGSAFNYWRFEGMGENAARNWSAEEEKKFNIIVNEYRQTIELWDKLGQSFPARSRSAIVNYYYNVFLVRHRAKQNRHTPHHIDSDIEESEPKVHSARKVVDTKNCHPSIYNSPKKQKKST